MAVKKVMKAVGRLDQAQGEGTEEDSTGALMDAQGKLMEDFAGLVSHMNLDVNQFTLGDVTNILTILQTGDLPEENPTE